MKPLERLGEARTPDGTLLQFYRHDGAYLIRADGVELMSTRRHLSEDTLAEVACAGLTAREGVRVLIGGLGLGFTLREALSAEAMQDPRVRIVHEDVVKVLRANPDGFDAIMLDTDNGPEGMIMAENSRLYSAGGIVATMEALRPGGVMAYWSVGDDPGFAGALQRAGCVVTDMKVRAHATSGPFHTLYIARPGRKASQRVTTPPCGSP